MRLIELDCCYRSFLVGDKAREWALKRGLKAASSATEAAEVIPLRSAQQIGICALPPCLGRGVVRCCRLPNDIAHAFIMQTDVIVTWQAFSTFGHCIP